MRCNSSLMVGIDPSARIGAGAFVGPDVSVGPDAVIGENAVIVGHARLGARVRVGPGTVIGAAGFGYEFVDGKYHHLPHTGGVIVEDDVEIGANCTVCRAKHGRETRIGQGTKIDSQVHIAHNVRIGKHCVIAAQTGIAGSVIIGDYVMIGGQVGVKDHVRIGDNAVILARAAVFRSVPPGACYSGIPARHHDQTKRFWAGLWRRFGKEESDAGAVKR
ncbi:MAG: UDP-3-O-(3-hydroxymyristoyl)glucosamine N-acyltransferase [candidate division WOR-3 bacterium]